MQLVVLGAGLMGVTSAYRLAEEGHDVTVIDRREGPGLETSFANGGQLGFREVSPWAAPDVPWTALKMLGDPAAPFRWKPKAELEQWRWLLAFLLRCNSPARAERERHNLSLGLFSQKELEGLLARLACEGENLSFDHKRKGILRLLPDAKAVKHAKAEMARLADMEPGLEVLEAGACVALEPALASIHQRGELAGGLYAPGDQSGDAHLFTRALAKRAEAKGVRFLYGREITSFEESAGRLKAVRCGAEKIEAEAFVFSLGVGGLKLARKLGFRLPFYPVKGYSVSVEMEEGAPEVSLTDEGRRIVVSNLGGRLRAAGKAEIAGFDTALDRTRARAVLQGLTELIPAVGEAAEAEFWTGLRPMTADGSPIIDKAPGYQNLYLNTGHGTLGWTLAMGSASLLADLIGGKATEIDSTPFALKRPSLFP